MHPLVKALPKQSILHYWLQAREIIETPYSFDLVCGLAALGAMLKRTCWIDQYHWKVYPNTSVLLVGPSGSGKNTAINGVEGLIQKLGIRLIGGKTIETLTDQVQKCGDPACAVIMAKELSDFIGKKDYQQGLLQGLTDLLDTGEFKDITIKSDNGQRRITRPTVTILAGSTPSWLHKAMPPEAMAGGFYPRFIIVAEDDVKRQVPLVKALPQAELDAAMQANDAFTEAVMALQVAYAGEQRSWVGEMRFEPAGQALYDDWYRTRLDFFSKIASDYAHRSRDHALRAAMVSAVSCGRRQLGLEDVEFGIALMMHIAKRVDQALAAPSIEAEICKEISKMLPAQEHEILFEMSKGYSPRHIRDAISLMKDSHQMKAVGNTFTRIKKVRDD